MTTYVKPSDPDTRLDIALLAKPLFRTETLTGFAHRSKNRTRVDKMQRAQKKFAKLRKLALTALSDPAAPERAKAEANAVIDGHRNRITAIERTHGRAINREVVREQRRAGRIGSPAIVTTKAATIAKPPVPNCKHQRAILEIKIPDVLPPQK